MSRVCRFAVFLMGFVFSGCTAVSQSPAGPWESPLHPQHPLTGTLWQVSANRQISVQEALALLGASRVAILGEKHDNPDHHRLQAFVLEALADRGALAKVSFEMLDSGQSAALASLTPQDWASESRLKEQLQWDEEGWEWAFYGPMLRALLERDIPVRTANIARDEMMAIYGGTLDPAVESRLNEEQREKLNQDIDESHCGMLPASQFPAMVRVQQSRDAAMANSLMSDAELSGVRVLIAGNFHARRDLGVPNYLTLNEEEILSLAFVEVQPSLMSLDAYLEAFSSILPYDLVWFTPAVEEQDYCAQMTGSGAQQ